MRKKNGIMPLILLAVVVIIGGAAVYKNFGGREGAFPGPDRSPAAYLTSTASSASASPKPGAASIRPQPSKESYDVVLVGSEMEGMYLARAAKDEGLKVKVIDPRDKPGGQLLQAQMLFLDATSDEKGKSLLQGRVKELFDGFRSAKIRKLSEFAAYYEGKLARDIPIESGIQIESVETSPGFEGQEAVTALTYRTKDGKEKKIAASYWVENSDFGALADKLKATRMPGLEKFYGQDTIEYMSAGMMMNFKNVNWSEFNSVFNGLSAAERGKRFGGGSVNESYAIGLSGMTKAYQPGNDRVFLRGLNAVNQRDGDVSINALLVYDVNPADPGSVAEAVELGNRESPRILEHFRRTLPGWEHAELNGLPSYPYIREYNHYETDYVLQVSDMLGGRMFYDNVSISGYPLDLQGITANKWGIEMGRPDKYGMPLRSFLLKNCENVIMAGKNVGSTAVAYGSARIQPNTALAAESIGIIIGQLKGSKKLKELTEQDWPALHAYLEKQARIKLTGVQGRNKIAGWTGEEISKLNSGEIVFTTYKRK